MKKIAYVSYGSIDVLSSKDYIIIEEYGRNLDDKYVDTWGKKFKHYELYYGSESSKINKVLNTENSFF